MFVPFSWYLATDDAQITRLFSIRVGRVWSVFLMNKTKRSAMTMAEIKQLIESGLLLRHVARASNYSVQELSLFMKAWGITRKRGRRKQQLPVGTN
jgi:hypothetical protein